jgi:hypothetical protein
VVSNGATGAEAPVVPEVKADAPKNAAGTAPMVGQNQADANAKALEKKAADDATIKKNLDDAKAAKDAEIASQQAADKVWGEWKPKAAEGLTRDEAAMKELVPLARELGLKPEGAQKLLDLSDKFQVAQQKAAVQAAQVARGKDLASLRADPVLGGEKFDAALRTANKVIDRFGTPEMKQYLAATLQDANPHFFKLFHSIGLAMQDDRIADGAGLGGGKTQKAGFASLYNHPTSKR